MTTVTIRDAELRGVRTLKWEVQEDFRGTFRETFHDGLFQDLHFVEDDCSYSVKHVLRGIHADSEAWKLLTCLDGRIYLVLVDCDRASDSFGNWEAFILTRENGVQVLVPPKYGIAHLVLSDHAVFAYKQTKPYDRKRQATYRFDDPRFRIFWPVKDPLLSARDRLDA